MYSFDIFDTLITRTTVSPDGIFSIMQTKLQLKGDSVNIPAYVKENFRELRIGAEQMTRKSARFQSREDIVLKEIYEAIATIGNLSKQQIEWLYELEIQTELDNVVGISENIEIYKTLKKEGNKLVLISDMYLSAGMIKKLLVVVDDVFEDAIIYVSCEYGKTKGSSRLFREVAAKEKADYSEWIHIGDNPIADGTVPASLGIKTKQVGKLEKMSFEQVEGTAYKQILLGVTQRARAVEKASRASDIGATLGGPILYAYINWVIEESSRRNIERLYFVARDGWVLKKIADCIIEKRQLRIKTKYIYGSRKAWKLPSVSQTGAEFSNIIKFSGLVDNVSRENLEKVFEIPAERLIKIIQTFPLLINWNDKKQISLPIQRAFIGYLDENEELAHEIFMRQTSKRDLVVKYLKQEIDFSDDNFAFVELSGTGLTQGCLGKIISGFSHNKIKSFFMRMSAVNISTYCENIVFQPGSTQLDYMVELLCRAPHGQTIGYRINHGQAEPVFDREEEKELKNYNITGYAGAVVRYTEIMEDVWRKNKIVLNCSTKIFNEYLNILTSGTEKWVNDYFRNMPFSNSGQDKECICFAPAISYWKLLCIYLFDVKNQKRYYTENIEYALNCDLRKRNFSQLCKKVRSNKRVNKYIWHIEKIKRHQKFGSKFFCDWEYLGGTIAVYGAGQVGKMCVKQAREKYAKCDEIIWVDTNYLEYQNQGLSILNPECLKEKKVDRVLIAVHNEKARVEIKEKLVQYNINPKTIFFV